MRLVSFYGLLLALCVIGLFVVSCKSSGDPSTALIIESISPSGIVGITGDDVQFSAVVTGIVGTPTYAWDFGGGAAPDTSSEAAPTVELGSANTYTGLLTVLFQGEDITTPFTFQVVDVPVVQSVTPSGSAGLPLRVVTFVADVVGDPTSFAWTFDDGALPAASTEEAPSVTLQNPGTYTGNLVATNVLGDSEPFPFSFTVDAPVAPEWTFVRVGTETAVGRDGLSMQAVNGRLILTYNMTQNVEGVFSNVIRFTEATVEIPTASTDFRSHTVDAESGNYIPQLSGVQSLGVSAAGIPYLIYGTNPASPESTTRIAFGTAAPTSAADWHISNLEIGGSTNDAGSAVLVMEEQILALIPTSGDIEAYLSTSLEPSGASDWVGHLAGRNDPRALDWPMAALIDGSIQFCAAEADLRLLGGLSYFRSLAPLPTSENDWLRFVVDARDYGYTNRQFMIEWEGTPVISYHGSPSLGNVAFLYFPESAEPESSDDFKRVQISPDGLRTVNRGFQVGANRLAVLYSDLDAAAFNLLRQVGADATLPDSWEVAEVGPLGQDFARPAALAVIDNRLAVIFVDPRNDLLTLAIADGPY